MYKQAARDALKARRAEITDGQARAARAAEKLAPLLHGNVMVYMSIGSEMPTDKLVELLLKRNDITVFAPQTKDGEITARRLVKRGKPDGRGNLPPECYGDCGEIDFCVTPLIGFDKNGYRIGYGMGCYDRFFARSGARRIGLAYAAQKAEFVHEAHDIPLDACVTEDEVIYFTCA